MGERYSGSSASLNGMREGHAESKAGGDADHVGECDEAARGKGKGGASVACSCL